MQRCSLLAAMGMLAVRADSYEQELPTGVIFNLNATELETQMQRNAQFEKEFFEGNYVSTAEITNGNMAHCGQICDEWCWATSATMAASVFGGGSNCAQNEIKIASNRLGSQCDSSCSSRCNQAGSEQDIIDGIRLLSGANYKSSGVLSQSQLDSALQGGPVVILVRWNGGGGHAVAVEGVSGGNYRGYNPWPVGQGKSFNVQYSGLTNFEGRGRWTLSVSTSGGPGPSPSPYPRPTPYPSPYPSPSPSPYPCVDREQDCRGWAQQGYCSRSSQYYQYMYQNCCATCGFGGEELGEVVV